VLLENNKWYVEYTERKNWERFLEHFKIEGAKWGGSKCTELHNPIQIVEYKEGTKEDETRVYD
jgi:hypothetical protein